MDGSIIKMYEMYNLSQDLAQGRPFGGINREKHNLSMIGCERILGCKNLSAIDQVIRMMIRVSVPIYRAPGGNLSIPLVPSSRHEVSPIRVWAQQRGDPKNEFHMLSRDNWRRSI